ncbi:MAG: rhodanese-like domain-containing protein [Elusimicrobiota bacterium]
MTKNIKISKKGPKSEPPAEDTITAAEVKKMLDDNKDFKLLDIRSEPEFRMMHIEGAQFTTRELVDQIFSKWPKDTEIVLYDHKGPQGLMGVQALVEKGFTRIKAMAGGIDAWSEQIDPLIPRY